MRIAHSKRPCDSFIYNVSLRLLQEFRFLDSFYAILLNINITSRINKRCSIFLKLCNILHLNNRVIFALYLNTKIT